jgi:hypothetical protein
VERLRRFTVGMRRRVFQTDWFSPLDYINPFFLLDEVGSTIYFNHFSFLSLSIAETPNPGDLPFYPTKSKYLL